MPQLLHILLADDDKDDCLFFREALDEIKFPARLFTVSNGVELMQYLSGGNIPDILFLDLNMQLKNGYECLREIRINKNLDRLKVIIYSTSWTQKIAEHLEQLGADDYIQKPPEFSLLKEKIRDVLVQVFPVSMPSRSKRKTRRVNS